MGEWPSRGGSRSETSSFVGLTANASANTKATSYTTVIASTTFRARHMIVLLGLSHELRAGLVDIAIGAAASEQIIAANLRSAYRFDQCPIYHLPVDIPAGTRISARCQASTGSSTIGICVILTAGGWGQLDGLPIITTYGADTSTSKGTSIDPGATPNTDSSWVQFSASCQDTRLLIVSLSPGTIQDYGGSGWTNSLDIGIGAGGSEQEIVSNLVCSFNTVTDIYQPQVFQIPCRIPAGTRIAAKCQSSTGTSPNRVLNLILYGVGG